MQCQIEAFDESRGGSISYPTQSARVLVCVVESISNWIQNL
jgi:hypothetical protein